MQSLSSKPLGRAVIVPLAAFFACYFGALAQTAFSQNIIISEVLADNESVAVPNRNQGDFPDWVEFYNPTFDYINMGGMVLTNFGATNIASVRSFTFPETWLGPNEYLIVFYDTNNVPGELHSGFGLEKNNGDRIELFDSNGTLIDEVGFGIQLNDLSIGRMPDDVFGYYWTLTRPTPLTPNVPINLGSPAQLKINEWMPTNGLGTHGFDDWLELYNTSTNPVMLGGLVVSPVTMYPVNHSISNLSFLAGNDFQLFYCNKKKSTSDYDADELDFSLSFSKGEIITIFEADRMTTHDQITIVPLSASAPWVSTNVVGGQTTYTFYSQGRLPDGDTNLMFFHSSKSTPGDSNFLPFTNVVVNEILAHTDPPLQDAVEFYNPSPSNYVDISRFWLSNSKNDPKRFRIPANTIIPPLGYKVIYEYQFNPFFNDTNRFFNFNSSSGDQCYLFSASNDVSGTLTGYRRGVDFGASANGVSFGRHVTSSGEADMVAMSSLSLGSPVTRTWAATTENSNLFVSGTGGPNPYPLMGPIVVTELMYHPPEILVTNWDFTITTNDNTEEEFVELYNMSTSDVRLYDTNTYIDAHTNRWRVNKAVDYTLPQFRNLGPGEFMLVVSFDPTNTPLLSKFRAKYKIPEGFTNIYGPYRGKLKNSGDSLEFEKTDPRQTTGEIGYVPKVLMDKVNYDDDFPWPTNDVNNIGPDGGGLSIRRLVPERYASEPTNWVAAVPTPGWRDVMIESYARNGSTLTMTFTGWAGSGYTLQYCTNIAVPFSATTWRKATDIAPQASTGPRQVSDVVPPGEKRFYRVVSPIQ